MLKLPTPETATRRAHFWMWVAGIFSLLAYWARSHVAPSWRSADGRVLFLYEMDPKHLRNAIRMLERERDGSQEKMLAQLYSERQRRAEVRRLQRKADAGAPGPSLEEQLAASLALGDVRHPTPPEYIGQDGNPEPCLDVIQLHHWEVSAIQGRIAPEHIQQLNPVEVAYILRNSLQPDLLDLVKNEHDRRHEELKNDG